MHNWKIGLAFLALTTVSLGELEAHAAGEIVVANRYLLPNKTSHAHLYLYREDGKLLRQLTKDNSGQDRNPIFAPDGETIVWTRELPQNKKQFWSIRPLGNGLQRLKTAPAWYRKTATSPYYTNLDVKGSDLYNPASGDDAPVIRTPDARTKLILRESLSDESDGMNGEGHGKHYLLRDVKSKKETEFGKLPVFLGVFNLLHANGNSRQHFLWEKNLHLTFFDLHLDSTEGDTTFALDLINRRLVRLGKNWATPIPLPVQSAFLSFNFERYVPIPGTKKTANCRYFELFDAKLHKVRFARTNCTLNYGASFYRPGRIPRVINIPDSE